MISTSKSRITSPLDFNKQTNVPLLRVCKKGYSLIINVNCETQ